MEEHSTVQLRRDTVGEDVTANGTALGRMKVHNSLISLISLISLHLSLSLLMCVV